MADPMTATCKGCDTSFTADPDDLDGIIAGGWHEDGSGATWCPDCDRDDNYLQPVAEFADGTVYSIPIPRDPWALLNRARYGCPVCDKLIDHDDLTGDRQHERHLSGLGFGAWPWQGRRVAA